MIKAFSYLQRNHDSGILYFRFAIPSKYRSAFGKSEIKFSLGTADKRVAVIHAVKHYAAIQEKFLKLDNKMKKKSKPEDTSFGTFQKIIQNEVNPVTGEIFPRWEVDLGDTDKELEALRILSNVKPVAPPPTPQKEPLNGDSVKLVKLFKLFVDEKIRSKAWTPKTLVKYEAIYSEAVRIIGNIESQTISYRHGRELQDVLAKLPPHTGKKFPGMTIKQILATGHKERMSLTTQNLKIQGISSVFIWAIRHGYASTNPFDGLQVKGNVSQQDQKDKFADEDIQKIFNPETFNINILKDEWKHWMPLLGLFTGARRTELAQLRTEDVFTEDGIVAIKITPDAGHLKNDTSARIIPLHSKLIALGFMEYAERIKAQKADKLFPRLWGTAGGPGKKAGDWFNNTFIPPLNLEGKKSFHSFRHTFIDGLFKKLVDDRVIKEMSGHAHGNIGSDRYSKGLDLVTLKNGVEHLEFHF
jgi:integrase